MSDLWGIPGYGMQACCYCCERCTRHICRFPCVSCTDEIKKKLVWELWEISCISALIYPCPRRGGPYSRRAHRTGARRKAVPATCLFPGVENSWATISIFAEGWGTELGAGEATRSWVKTHHVQCKAGDLPLRERGEQRQLLFQSPSAVLL